MLRFTFICASFLLSMPVFAQTTGVRVTNVEAENPSDWGIRLSAVDESGKVMSLSDHEVTIYLATKTEPFGVEPYLRFRSGSADKGFRGTLTPIGKAKDLTQAVVFVVALHSDIPVEVLDPTLKSIQAILEELRKDARVGMVFYGDRIQVLWSNDGSRLDVRDINDFQHCLADMRQAAGSFQEPTQAVSCGRLFMSPESVSNLLRALPARQGLFPRLFGISEASEVMEEAKRRGHERVDRSIAQPESFASGAIEAAARMLAANTEPGVLRDVILFSDGRDGYLRVAEVAHAHAVRKCSGKDAKCRLEKGALDEEGGSKECVVSSLKCSIPKVAEALTAREQAVRDYLATLLPLLRALGVRVFTIAFPGTDEVGLARLTVISHKTGGSIRVAANPPSIPVQAGGLAEELASEVLIKPFYGLNPECDYKVVAVVDHDLRSEPFEFKTGGRKWPLANVIAAGRVYAIKKLGHRFGPPIFWAALVIAMLFAIGLTWTFGKTIKSMVQRFIKKAPKPPKLPHRAGSR